MIKGFWGTIFRVFFTRAVDTRLTSCQLCFGLSKVEIGRSSDIYIHYWIMMSVLEKHCCFRLVCSTSIPLVASVIVYRETCVSYEYFSINNWQIPVSIRNIPWNSDDHDGTTNKTDVTRVSQHAKPTEKSDAIQGVFSLSCLSFLFLDSRLSLQKSNTSNELCFRRSCVCVCVVVWQ